MALFVSLFKRIENSIALTTNTILTKVTF